MGWLVRENVIKMLERCVMPHGDGCTQECEYHGRIECCRQVMRNTLALLKAQEPIEARLHLCESCMKEYPECDATIDGIEFGCGVGNDNIIGCTAYVNRWKAQEPVEPTLRGGIGGYWYCGACNYQISRGDKFCRYCGQAVKWK